MLEQKGCAHIHVVVIDTYMVPQGKLWNARQIATDLGFLDGRVRFHEHVLRVNRARAHLGSTAGEGTSNPYIGAPRYAYVAKIVL